MVVKRVNITLSEELLNLLKKETKNRERSAVISEALELYLKKKNFEDIVQEMIEGYKDSYDEDLELNEEWSIAASPKTKYVP